MYLSKIDYPSLQQMLDSLQLDHVFTELDHVLVRQVSVGEKRLQLSEAAGLISQSATALVKLLKSTLEGRLTEGEAADIEEHLNELEMDCCSLSARSEEHLEINMKLGAQEHSLSRKLTQLKPVIYELAASVGLDTSTLTPHIAKTSQAREDSIESSDESEDLPWELEQYWKAVARTKTLQERLDAISMANVPPRQQINHITRQLSSSNGDSEGNGALLEATVAELRKELARVQMKASMSKCYCIERGIDIEEGRWRRRRTVRDKSQDGDRDESRFRGWLAEVQQDDHTSKESIDPMKRASAVMNHKNQQGGQCLSDDNPKQCHGPKLDDDEVPDAQHGQIQSPPSGPTNCLLKSYAKNSAPTRSTIPDPVALPSKSASPSSGIQIKTHYRQRQPNFYSLGTVFKVLKDSLERGGSNMAARSVVTDNIVGAGRNGAPAVQQVLWYLAIGRNDKYCHCLRILTYQGRGVSDLPNEDCKSNYSIAYTGKVKPEPTAAELDETNGREVMREPIRIKPNQFGLKLKPMQRLNWTEVHEVPLDVKSASFGKVHPQSRHAVEQYVKDRLGSLTEMRKTSSLSEQNTLSIPTPSREVYWRLKVEGNEGTSSSDVIRSLEKSQQTNQSRFRKGDIVDLVIDRGYLTQDRRCRRLIIQDTKFSDGKWQYVLRHFKHSGLYSEGTWVDESPWMVPAK